MPKKAITITENEIKRIVAECVAKLQESGETPSECTLQWKTKGRDKNGVPIPEKPYYELTDTYRY